MMYFEARSGARANTLEELATNADAFDVPALAAYILSSAPLPRDATPYLGIRALCTKSFGEPHALSSLARTPDEAVALLIAAMEGAVARAAGDARNIAILTGGGLDSAGLLAVAVAWAARAGRRVFAVALDFEGPGDDRPHLRALEAALGCEVQRVAPEEGARHAQLFFTGVDAAPFGCPTGPLEVALLERARLHGADVVLGGAGGDQLFDGRPFDVASPWAAHTLEGFAMPRLPALSWWLRPRIAARVPMRLRREFALRKRLVLPAWAGPALDGYARRNRRQSVDEGYGVTKAPGTILASEAYTRLFSHQLELAAGIRLVDVYLDDESLKATVRALPPAWLLWGNRRRGLFREAMRGLLPESVRMRPDKARFEPALARLLAAMGGCDVLASISRADQLASLGLVDKTSFARAFMTFALNPKDSSEWPELWPALAVESFLQHRLPRGNR